ncbi:transcription factor HIVEP3-like isoform X2 [Neocloeon triangulifer]|nr:transcription factor HIVEP3-like isoform X2 [Neocloeon triangulifer]
MPPQGPPSHPGPSAESSAASNDSSDLRYRHKKFQKMALASPSPPPAAAAVSEGPVNGSGRYVCPYCQMACAKPSVLQKHVRAHTNERPYPCRPCGFAFKTKSNLYKHCRSRTHAIKAGEPEGMDEETDELLDSDDEPNPSRPYKPKFQGQCPPGSPEFLQRHISKIISENQAIVETVDPLWSRRYHRNLSSPATEQKTAGRSAESSKASRLAHALTRPKEEGSEPLNLSVSSPQRRRSDGGGSSNGFLVLSPPSKIARLAMDNHPQNPEGSIIKDLLLKARQGADMAELLSSEVNPALFLEAAAASSDSSPAYVCDLCRISYRNSENLEIHQRYYCKGPQESAKKNSLLQHEAAKLAAALELAALATPPPFPSPGPLLGSTPLVGGYNDAPASKRQRLSSEERPPSTASLRSLEELSRSPRPMQMFGGKVHINDGHEPKTMIIDPCRPPAGTSLLPEQQPNSSGRSSPTSITISRCNLNSGGTIVQMIASTSQSSSSNPANAPLVPDQQLLAAVARPIVPKITAPSLAPSLQTPYLAYNPLTLPSVPTPTSRRTSSDAGVVTIVHGGREIPYVPGMPGPQSLTESRPLDLVCGPPPAKPDIPLKPTQSTPPPLQPIKSHPPRSPPPADSPSEEGPPKPKFLRPTSLPLKPGTFAPKRPLLTSLAGTTLVSPETPRPRKSYGQLYLNGHAYTYLGLKCSTRVFYCCLTQPQPMYVPQSTDPKLSMYSNWRVLSPSADPPEMAPAQAMALYDSRHRPNKYSIASTRPQSLVVTHSSQWDSGRKTDSPDSNSSKSSSDAKQTKEQMSPNGEPLPKRVKIFAGGFESNEEYTYVRGRGRGKYVCEECGIRCKKPSMLKKHIRTHTDVRPFTCKHCSFSFKTKGNLTKHMKSKAHYKKCMELGILPVPTAVEDSNIDEELLLRQQALRVERGDGPDSESDEEDDEDEDDDEDDDEDSMQISDIDAGQREAACSLLSLAEQHVGLIPISARPFTYPYSSGPTCTTTTITTAARTPTISSVSAHSEREKVSRNTRLVMPEQKGAAAPSGGGDRYYFPSKRDESASGSTPEATPPPMDLSRPAPVTPVPDSAALLAALCSTVERLPQGGRQGQAPPDMLHAYLTEKALHDVRIKQHQVHRWRGLPPDSNAATPNTPVASPAPSLLTPTLACNMSALLLNSPMKEVSSESHPPSAPPKLDNLNKAAAIGQQHVAAAAAAIAAAGGSPPHSASPSKPKAEFMPPASGPGSNYGSLTEDGKSQCAICNKVFSKPSQLRLHVNIHYFERPFRCESCAVSFRTKGHLQKHERSVSHQNKVSMNSTFGMPTTDNPRPFKCEDCKIAFRIHGHLAKHLRSKMHIMKLECLGKLPFGTYAEMERSGINLNEIDTTDCDNSLESLQILAQKIYEKDPSKLQPWDRRRTTSESSEDMTEDPGEMYMGHGQGHHMQAGPSAMDDGMKHRLMSGSDYDDGSEGEPDVGHEVLSYKCPICEQAFPSVNSLKVHIFVDHSNAPSEAPMEQPDKFRGRIDSSTSQVFKCDLCGLHLPSQDSLHKHVASHSQPRPFVCKYCDAGFTSKTHLLQHLALHQAGAAFNGPLAAPN